MSTGLPGGEKGEEPLGQREQHEQNYGGGKSIRHLGNSVAGESGPKPEGQMTKLERGLMRVLSVR